MNIGKMFVLLIFKESKILFRIKELILKDFMTLVYPEREKTMFADKIM